MRSKLSRGPSEAARLLGKLGFKAAAVARIENADELSGERQRINLDADDAEESIVQVRASSTEKDRPHSEERRVSRYFFAWLDPKAESAEVVGSAEFEATSPLESEAGCTVSVTPVHAQEISDTLIECSDPAGFTVRMPDGTSAVFARESPSAAVGGILLSDQVANSKTVDEVHGAIAGHVQELIGKAELAYTGGRDVYLPQLGRGVERSWAVKRTTAGLRALVLPICQGTGSFVIWQLWLDEDGASALHYWLSSVRPTAWAEPPVCAQLNP